MNKYCKNFSFILVIISLSLIGCMEKNTEEQNTDDQNSDESSTSSEVQSEANISGDSYMPVAGGANTYSSDSYLANEEHIASQTSYGLNDTMYYERDLSPVMRLWDEEPENVDE